LESTDRLESVANVHTAADLHVRPVFQNRAGLKIVGAASNLEIHDAQPLATKLIQDQRGCLVSNAHIDIANDARGESKFLNHRRKSRGQSSLSQFARYCKKIFTNPSSNSRRTDFSKRFISLWG
jgi:hypothetical protein